MTKALVRPDFDVPYEQGRHLQSLTDSGFLHAFFGRCGGVSTGIYEGLNCATGSDDEPSSVIENRERVAAVMNIKRDDILQIYQTHSSICLYLEQPWAPGSRPQADAVVTKTRGVALSVLTADCAPVVLCGFDKAHEPVAGIAHAGWKGALGGIIEETVSVMHEAGALPDSISACIGPCIGRRSYEVGKEFYDSFTAADSEYDHFFTDSQNPGHYMFDLPGFISGRLATLGISHVEILDQDTYTQEEKYYSYRRATHLHEPDYGRQLSVALIL